LHHQERLADAVNLDAGHGHDVVAPEQPPHRARDLGLAARRSRGRGGRRELGTGLGRGLDVVGAIARGGEVEEAGAARDVGGRGGVGSAGRPDRSAERRGGRGQRRSREGGSRRRRGGRRDGGGGSGGGGRNGGGRRGGSGGGERGRSRGRESGERRRQE